jgi:hypothetical protein
LRPYARGTVIEVGAGLGSTTLHLCTHSEVRRWICLEPDAAFAANLEIMSHNGVLPSYCEIKNGILSDLSPHTVADSIFYIDVLEHIKDDTQEMRLAASYLEAGGWLVVLSPAFNCLFSPFDRAIGHFRRYSRRDTRRLTVPGLSLERVFFLDSVGILASLANKIILKSNVPSIDQIRFWDQQIVPISIYLDRLVGWAAGRSIVMVWKKL